MVYTLLIILALLFTGAILYIQSNGGILKNLYFSFSILVYLVYYMYSGFFSWEQRNFIIIGNTIEDIFEKGLIFYCMGMACFITGYITGPANKSRPKPFYTKKKYFDQPLLLKLTLLFLVISYVIRFVGSGLSGSLDTYIYSTQDFLITLTIGLYLRKVRPAYLLTFVVAVFILFSSNFFRYRIILTVTGLGVIYLYRHPEFFQNILKYAIIGVMAAYAFLFITLNRQILANLAFDEIHYNVFEDSENSQSIVLDQGSNIHADFTVFKYYRDHPEARHDYGETMFIYPFIRALPGFLFADGKPYPPSLQTIVNAYGGDYTAEHSGKAVTNIGEFYIAFGITGIVAGMFLFGRILKILQNKWVWDNSYNSLLELAILVSLFQYITRGYFPQYVNHIAFLVIPVYLLRRYSKKPEQAKPAGHLEKVSYY